MPISRAYVLTEWINCLIHLHISSHSRCRIIHRCHHLILWLEDFRRPHSFDVAQTTNSSHTPRRSGYGTFIDNFNLLLLFVILLSFYYIFLGINHFLLVLAIKLIDELIGGSKGIIIFGCGLE
jgi:hypothetical protein